jgi:anhydro-N-acetylmuramic acid kinase
MTRLWALGLMTGTVLDGMVDIAMIRTNGVKIEELGPWELVPYPKQLRALLSQAQAAALEWRFEGPEPGIFRDAEEALTRAQIGAVSEFLTKRGIARQSVAVIGFHGQTVLHRAPRDGERGDTRQLGDGPLMARALGIDVAYDFRTADVRAGGQGAPLSARYHRALLEHIGAAPNSGVLNLGGVANLTWWGGGDELIAFDTGPANAPLDDWMRRNGLGDMDRGGSLARQGRVDEERLATLLQHPHFSASYPKSLDRNDFSAALTDGLSPADGAATLAAFVGAAVGCALDLLPRRPSSLVLCGGGRKNAAIVEAIRARAGVTAVMAEAVGWRGDAIEAECFGYLAVRVAGSLPISFPLTTGVPRPMTGGRLALAARSTYGGGA